MNTEILTLIAIIAVVIVMVVLARILKPVDTENGPLNHMESTNRLNRAAHKPPKDSPLSNMQRRDEKRGTSLPE